MTYLIIKSDICINSITLSINSKFTSVSIYINYLGVYLPILASEEKRVKEAIAEFREFQKALEIEAQKLLRIPKFSGGYNVMNQV